MLPRGEGPPVMVVYDCVLSPTMVYVHHGRHPTRAPGPVHRLNGAACGGVAGGPLRVAPAAGFPHPDAQTLLCVRDLSARPAGVGMRPRPFHGAIRSCQSWATTTRVACDGVVFADTRRVGYHVPDRLWKLKDLVSGYTLSVPVRFTVGGQLNP